MPKINEFNVSLIDSLNLISAIFLQVEEMNEAYQRFEF